MRIAIDGRALQNSSWYQGIGTYSSNLIQALTQIANPHHLIPFGYQIQRRSECIESPIQDLIDRQGFRITGRRSLLDRIDAHGVDLCHVLEITPPFPAPHRTVATVYDLIPLVFPKVYIPWWKIRNAWKLATYHRFLKRVPQILAISHHTKDDLVRLLRIPPDRIRVIYPGINPGFRPLRDSLEIQPVLMRYGIPTPYVLYVGSCNYRKNIPGLMRAFAQLQTGEFGEFHLVLVGKVSEPNQKWLREYGSALGLAHRLHLTGYVPLKHLVTLYNAATMLVSPSFYEGFGYPPLEAMACGVPAVTSKNSSLSEVTGGCALQVNPCDDEELAKAMRRIVLDHGLRNAIIQKGLTHVRQFDWNRTAREILQVYEEAGASLRSSRFPGASPH